MKKLIWTSSLAMAACIALPLNSQAQSKDSMKLAVLQEVTVKAVRASKNAPFAVANINKKTLRNFAKTGQELPLLFARTPGILAWSENGVGTGSTYMRIRGAAGSRINVTLDGVALNSPEDQTVFWANMNSYAALLGSAQIQRGIGTSTNGDGAFGGTISLNMAAPSEKPSLEVNGSYGSYNTANMGLNFSSGLLLGHLIVDGAYHHTTTDGFVHGTSGNSGSFYGGLTWMGNNLTVRYKNVGNYEHTGQAWSGVTAGNGDYSMNRYDGVKTYKDMYDRGLGRYNSLYEAFTTDGKGDWSISRYKMSDGKLWEKTTDNFTQDHNILSATWQPSARWTHNAALHYTYGHGYYEEFRPRKKFKDFGIVATYNDKGTSKQIKKADFVRRKGLTQHAYGLVYNSNYTDEHNDIIFGANIQQFRCNHYGFIDYIHAKESPNIQLTAPYDTKLKKYYDSDAKKNDYAVYIKETYKITPVFDIFADVQYRHVDYTTDGINDRFYKQTDGTFKNQQLNINKHYNFVNPKAGVSFHQNGHHAYFSAAYANREPERNNFTDNGSYPAPKAERLLDFEAGYNYSGTSWHAGANFYYMGYKDQFVQTGAQSDIGENLTTNIAKSYRTGVELTADCAPLAWLSIAGNAALSMNKIKDFDEVIETRDKNWIKIAPTVKHYDNSTLAFSPSAILNGFVDFHYANMQAVWHTNFVSQQYVDNTENNDRSLPAYSQTDIRLSYTWQLPQNRSALKEVVFGMNLNNIFNAHYASSAWVYSAIVGQDHPESNRYYQMGYTPMAGFTALGSVALRF